MKSNWLAFKTRIRKHRRIGAFAAALSFAFLSTFGCGVPAFAAGAYPGRPIRLLVGFSAGGATDLLARTLAQKLSSALGQSVVVENRPGAGGTIAANAVAKAPADGYTLLYTSAALTSNVSMYKTLPFDPVTDFRPITATFSTTYVLVVNPKLPARTVKEFIQYAKANPGMLTMASPGIGSSGHLGGVAFNHEAGIAVSHVPYKGTGDVLRDLMAGEVKSSIDSLPAYLPYIKDGTLRALCVGDPRRSPMLPEVPTCDEAGVPGYRARSWHGVMAPANTPDSVIELLNKKINQILIEPDVVAHVQTFGSTPIGDSPQEFTQMIRQNIAAFAELTKLAGIQKQ